MSKAFIDTTILTDILLKGSHEKGKSAKKELKKYTSTELPVYAIKEFKSAPLLRYAYAHNQLLLTGSYSKTLESIKNLINNPYQRRTATTALEALIEANNSMAGKVPLEFQKKYGKQATYESIQCDENRSFLYYLIMKAWKKRRSVTTHIVAELSCYEEISPYEKPNGTIELIPRQCKKEKRECSMAKTLKGKRDLLIKLRNSIDLKSTKQEDIARRQTLKTLIKHPNSDMTEKECKALGDAIFAFFAPDDSTIITTNLSDHKPLAEALGKKAKRPN